MPDDLTLSFTRSLDARPSQIWRCWIEPALLKQWFTPHPVRTIEADIDPRPGGVFRTVMAIPGEPETSGVAGCILVAERDTRLVWTNALGPGFRPRAFGTGPMDFAFTAEILIAPTVGGCTYTATVVHATPQAAQSHRDMGFFEGWGAVTTQLGDLAKDL